MENLLECMEMGKEKEEKEGVVVGHFLTMINVFEDGATCYGERPEGEWWNAAL